MLATGTAQKPLRHLEMAEKYASTSAESFAKSALNTIGWSNHVNGHVLHYITQLSISIRSPSAQDDWILSDLE